MKTSTDQGDIVDALEFLEDARRLMDLVNMTCRHNPDQDQLALSAGLVAALERIAQAETILQNLAQPDALKVA